MGKTPNKRNAKRKFSNRKRGSERPAYDNRRGTEREDARPQYGKTDSEAMNDISWYSRNPNLLIAAGSFPYPYRPGMQLNMGTTPNAAITANNPATRQFRIPGVLSLNWMPSIGVSNTATDPASVMAKEIYSRVREKYSGSLEADAPDFVMYLLALDSIFSYIAWLKRLYRVMNAWSPNNYAIPDVLLGSMWLSNQDIVSLRNNRTALWQGINELVLQSRKFTCPASMDIFNRHYWMSDNVYTDEASINSQFYIFNLVGVYQYASLPMPNSTDTAAGLKMVELPNVSVVARRSTTMTVDTLIQFGRTLIDSLVAWDDAYTINGYLMRAYEGEAMFVVDELPQDQPFAPVYVPEVLAQIENARTVPFGLNPASFEGFNITQDVLSNAVISNPSFTVRSLSSWDDQGVAKVTGWTVPPTLSIRSDSPTVADSVIASRLQASVTVDASGTYPAVTIDCASEVPLAWLLFTEVPNVAQVRDAGTCPVFVEQTPGLVAAGTLSQSQAVVLLTAVTNLLTVEQFDWHPFIFITTQGSQSPSGTPLSNYKAFAVLGDTHNITTITPGDLENLHRVCMFSELNSFSR